MGAGSGGNRESMNKDIWDVVMYFVYFLYILGLATGRQSWYCGVGSWYLANVAGFVLGFVV